MIAVSATAADSTETCIHPRVAFQGELGAYGDEAIAQRWRGLAEPVPSIGFTDVVDAVTSRRAKYGILPVWNSVVGDITTGSDAVRFATDVRHGLVALDDIHVVVRHQLLALPSTTLDEIRSVASHPVALAQCGRFLARHPQIRAREAYDTAGAARDLATDRTPASATSAVIASRVAAERYGLVVIESDVQDVIHNITRFVVLARPADPSSDDLARS